MGKIMVDSWQFTILALELEEELDDFNSFEEFKRIVNTYGDFIIQCYHCFVAWPSNKCNGEKPIVESCCSELNRLKVPPSLLGDMGIEVSHGLCEECTSASLQKLRRMQQQRESPFDCYGRRARDLFCDQADCKYSIGCFYASKAKYDPNRRSWRYPR